MKAILGSGQLGMAIADELLRHNPHEAILLVNRTGRCARALPANVEVTAADVTNRHEVEFIAREAEIIFSCTDVPYEEWGSFYPATAEALAYAISKTNARLVFADNLYAYGNVAGAEMHERMPHNAGTKKGMIRAAVINRLLHQPEPLSQRIAFVKAADFIGPGIHKGVLGTDFLQRLYSGKSIYLFGKPDLPHTFTYISDFARAMINVGNAPDTGGQIWHTPNSSAISVNDWIHLFEQQTGREARIKHIPRRLIRMAGLFNSFVQELYELAYQFEYPYLVSHNKYTARFGNHATSHEDVVAATISWYMSRQQQ